MLDDQISINRYRISKDLHNLKEDQVAVEEPLQISLSLAEQTNVFSIVMRTPGNDQLLAAGLLFSEGIIQNHSQIESFQVENIDGEVCANLLTVKLSMSVSKNVLMKNRVLPSYSGCGLCGKSNLKDLELKNVRSQKSIISLLNIQTIGKLRDALSKQVLFSETGGSHAVGLIYEQDGTLEFRNPPFFEDVGRHNALDKLIGYELREHNLNKPGILVLSGRIGFELVQKAVMAGYSAIVALGAPSSLAIQTAKQFDIVLIGFAKDDSFNLYTSDIQLIER